MEAKRISSKKAFELLEQIRNSKSAHQYGHAE